MTERKFAPYKKPVRSIVVQQLTQSGWVEIIRIPVETPEKNTAEQIQQTLEEIQDSFYKSDKLYLSAAGISLCVADIKASGTFRVCASYSTAEEPYTVY